MFNQFQTGAFDISAIPSAEDFEVQEINYESETESIGSQTTIRCFVTPQSNSTTSNFDESWLQQSTQRLRKLNLLSDSEGSHSFISNSLSTPELTVKHKEGSPHDYSAFFTTDDEDGEIDFPKRSALVDYETDDNMTGNFEVDYSDHENERSENRQFSLDLFPAIFREGDCAKQLNAIYEFLLQSKQLVSKKDILVHFPDLDDERLTVFLEMFHRKRLIAKTNHQYAVLKK